MTGASENVQYVGSEGVTQSCVNAVLRYVQFGDEFADARLLSCKGLHALALRTIHGEVVAVRSGFSSGYPGEGPKGLSLILLLLVNLDIDIIEREVEESFLRRLDGAVLTAADLDRIFAPPPAFGGGVYKYILPQHYERGFEQLLCRSFPAVTPYAVVDERLGDLAASFWDAPNDRLMKAYTRLETIVRDRTGINEHGSKLFQMAFHGDSAQLTWPHVGERESAMRAQMFIGTFGAFRNPRAHRELNSADPELVAELLAVNLLFRLERESVPSDGHA